MALRSRHFRGSNRLESCLAADAAHVTPGQRGDHVSLIQYALLRLQVPGISTSEVQKKEYGPTTGNAVLAFKRSFDIVNRSYQTTADSIVGKMTMAELDRQIWALEGFDGPPRQPRLTPYHPSTPISPGSPPKSFSPISASVKAPGMGVNPDFEPPLSEFPSDVQYTIARSNAAKKAGDLVLYPFIPNDGVPLSGKDLSKAFASHPIEMQSILDLYRRMKPFGIFTLIKFIHDTYRGIGSRGFSIDPFDHEAAMRWMTSLTSPKVTEAGVTAAPFCRDMWNVHGARDSFREVVAVGEGLHICITQPAQRGSLRCDFHIDAIQQGQVCFNGWCVPIANGQTAEHLWSVGPWLIKEASDKALKWGQRFKPPIFW